MKTVNDSNQKTTKQEIILTWFENLYEGNKVIFYQEEFPCIAELDIVKQTAQNMMLHINEKTPVVSNVKNIKTKHNADWVIGFSWQTVLPSYQHKVLSRVGAGAVIWFNPELVKTIEALIKDNNFVLAQALLRDSSLLNIINEQ